LVFILNIIGRIEIGYISTFLFIMTANADRKTQAQLFKALSHPLRILIVEQLMEGERCVNDIKNFFDASQPNISQHLNILKYADIVDFHQRGNMRCYFLKDLERMRAVILSARQAADKGADPGRVSKIKNSRRSSHG